MCSGQCAVVSVQLKYIVEVDCVGSLQDDKLQPPPTPPKEGSKNLKKTWRSLPQPLRRRGARTVYCGSILREILTGWQVRGSGLRNLIEEVDFVELFQDDTYLCVFEIKPSFNPSKNLSGLYFFIFFNFFNFFHLCCFSNLILLLLPNTDLTDSTDSHRFLKMIWRPSMTYMFLIFLISSICVAFLTWYCNCYFFRTQI